MAQVEGSVTGLAAGRTQWLSLSGLAAIRPAWQNLADRALERNVFYEPAFALAAADAFGRHARACLVWARDEPERLIGLFPSRRERRYGPGPSIEVGWTHPYAPLGLPLVDRDAASSAIDAWLDAIADETGLAVLPQLPSDGPFAAALRDCLAARRGSSRNFGAHARALLVPGHDRAGYLHATLSSKRRKEFERQRRRLADSGPVASWLASTPDEVAPALTRFMALEAAGWKGRAGTAAQQSQTTLAFMQSAVNGLAACGQAQVAELKRGQDVIASGIVLRSRHAAWFWKITYDETVAHASPGVQLTLALTGALLEDSELLSVDSCATADHPMIDRLWRERLPLADVLFSPRPAGWRFTLESMLERARRAAIGWAKRLRSRLTG